MTTTRRECAARLARHDIAGLAQRARLPVTITQWQSQAIFLYARLDSAVAGWDHSTGIFDTPFHCAISYPGGSEGPAVGDTIGAWAPDWHSSIPGREFKSGKLIRLRVQLLPDGRCGFAANGHPFGITDLPVIVDSTIRVALVGKSVKTRASVGRIEIFHGVRGGIDWAAFARATQENSGGKP